MKVLLIDPPGIDGNPVGRVLGSFGINKADQAWPPYDLQIFGGYLRKNGYEFRIIDANNLKLLPDTLKKEIDSYRPDWVIYLTCFQTFELDSFVARITKEISPEIKTACISLSIFSIEDPVDCLNRHPYLDYIIWSEPEISLMNLIKGKDPRDVKGIYYRSNGDVLFTGDGERVLNLDELGIPVHDGLPFHIYRCPLAKRRPMTIVNCSRGCINSCVHCQAGTFQKPLRYRSVDSVMEELGDIRRIGIKEVKFYDCSLPTRKDFVIGLCEEMLRKGFGFTWHCNARADRVDKEILSVMRRAGCHTISIGAESADPVILKNMRKNETLEEIEYAVRMVKESGMRVLMYLTFGLEGETHETMERTFRFVKRLMPDYVTFGIVVPAPGTPFYKKLRDKGYLVLRDAHLNDPTLLPAFNYPHLSGEDILVFTRSAYRRYYLSPGYIIKRLFSIRTFDEFISSVSNGIAVLKRYVVRTPH